MIKIIKFKLLAGAHHDAASGNSYECTPDKTVPPKPDAEDQNPTVIPGTQPVFESAMELDKTFRNKFSRMPEDTPVTARPDASALRAKAQNEAEEKRNAPPNDGKAPKGGRRN